MVEQTIIKILGAWEPYYCLFIIIFGFIGNSISFLVFGCSDLRHKEASYFLAGLAIADNGFLFTLLIVTLEHFKINIFHESIIMCKLIVFLTYVFSFLSIWYVVVFTVERFIIVYFPLKRHQICTRRRSLLILIILALFSLVFYSFSLFTSGIELYEEFTYKCVTLENYFIIVKKMIALDTFLTLIIPLITIFAMNLLIIIRLMKCLKKTDKKIFYTSRATTTSATRSLANVKTTSIETYDDDDDSINTLDYRAPIKPNETATTTNSRNNCKLVSNLNCCMNNNTKMIKNYGSDRFMHDTNYSNSYMYSSIQELSAMRNNNNCDSISKLSTRSSDRKIQQQPQAQAQPQQKLVVKYFNDKSQGKILVLGSNKSSQRKYHHNYSKTTKMLLIISSSFLILNTPIALSKIWYLIKHVIEESSKSKKIDTATNSTRILSDISAIATASPTTTNIDNIPVEEIIERVTCYLYYINFSSNFLLYAVYGSKFRQKILNFFKKFNLFKRKTTRNGINEFVD